MSKLIGILFTALFTTGVAHASCNQANLDTHQGQPDDVKISLHYSSCNNSEGDSATINPTIHVTLPGSMCPAQFVYATLISSQYGYSSSQSVQLSPNKNNICEFDSTSTVTVSQGYEGIADQQIAVSVESGNKWQWLVNPLGSSTQPNNFTYSFDANYCGGGQPNGGEVCN
jgi:hypothetical protein